MEVVLIVSKTQMSNGVCVGGIIERTGEFIRLHNERGGNLSIDAPYEVGDRWEMEVKEAWNARPLPHVEDRQTTPLSRIDNVGVRGIESYIYLHIIGERLTRGAIQHTFAGCLNFADKRCFVNSNRIPSFSTQFWIADKDLLHLFDDRYNKHYYLYENIRIRFVGCQKPVSRIPAGTIIRLSLANWWDGDGSGENRCYLQLSGWYL